MRSTQSFGPYATPHTVRQSVTCDNFGTKMQYSGGHEQAFERLSASTDSRPDPAVMECSLIQDAFG